VADDKDLILAFCQEDMAYARHHETLHMKEGHLDPKEVKNRCAEVRSLGQAKRSAFYNRCLQKEFTVLSERWHSKANGSMKGMTDNYIPVLFHQPKGKENEFVRVRLERINENMVKGNAVVDGPD
jgi:tRNA A37 methylthiotransferase MiaB